MRKELHKENINLKNAAMLILARLHTNENILVEIKEHQIIKM